MFVFSFYSALIEFDDEFVFDSSKSNVIAKKYRTYIEQQHARYEALRNAFNSSIVQTIVFKKKALLYQDNERQTRSILEKQLCKMNSIRLKNEKSIRHESNERLCEKF